MELCVGGGNIICCNTMENVEVYKKIKMEPSYDPAIPLTGIYPKVLKMGSQGDTHTVMFFAVIAKK